jgi:hypothetical protein
MQDYFADTIGNMTVIGTTVRIEFVRIASVDPETKQPIYESTHRLVMPIQGFNQSCDRQVALQKRLQHTGLMNPPPSPSSAASPDSASSVITAEAPSTGPIDSKAKSKKSKLSS